VKIIKIKDIAERAGVSAATVSRVLSPEGSARVSPETSRKVFEASANLGYEPNNLPAKMRFNRSKVIGIVVSDIENPFFTTLIRACESEAHEHGYRLIVVNTDEDENKELIALKSLASERVAGVILASIGASSSLGLVSLSNVGIPVVTVDNSLPDWDVDSVVTNNRAASRAATEHLLGLGHRRIAMITGPSRGSSIHERTEGFLSALREAGIGKDEFIIAEGDLREESGYLLTKGLLTRPDRPTALFTVNNLTTMGVLRAVRELEVEVPDQLSIIAFDDIPLALVLEPPQSVIAQPLREIGAYAVRQLVSRLADPDAPCALTVFDSTLTLRGSTGAVSDSFAATWGE